MDTYGFGQEWVTRFEDVAPDLLVVTDVREAHPPCLLVTPPSRTYDLACGATLTWTLVGLAPGPGNADSWRALDAIASAVEAVETPLHARPGSYVTQEGQPPLPCLMFTIEESR